MTSVKRAAADYAELKKPLYTDSGIYYYAEETNVLKGYGLVIGPKDTPYEDCPMFYEFTIPQTYPFDPPQVKFVTFDGKTRFHPNMYMEGRCCLSILGTWEGPKWASIMRISTVLVTLQSLMDDIPLRHEPSFHSISKTADKSVNYNLLVEHSCIAFTIQCFESIIAKTPTFYKAFVETLEARMPDTLKTLFRRLTMLKGGGERVFCSLPYSLHGSSNYSELLDRVIKLMDHLNISHE